MLGCEVILDMALDVIFIISVLVWVEVSMVVTFVFDVSWVWMCSGRLGKRFRRELISMV